MHVGMYLRAKVLYNLRYPLFDIGSREDKHNFLLKGPHCDVVMTWVRSLCNNFRKILHFFVNGVG